MITKARLQQLAKKHGTPLFVIDHDALRSAYRQFRKHLLTPRHQHDRVLAPRERVGERRADACRSAGDEDIRFTHRHMSCEHGSLLLGFVLGFALRTGRGAGRTTRHDIAEPLLVVPGVNVRGRYAASTCSMPS